MNAGLTKPFVHLVTGDTANTILECDEILHQNVFDDGESDPILFLIRGLAHAVRSEHQNAVNDFSYFIENQAEDDGARLYGYIYRAEVYNCLNEYELALNDLNAALECCEHNNEASDTLPDELHNLRTIIEDKLVSNSKSNVRDAYPQQVSPTLDEALEALANGNIEECLSLAEILCQQQPEAIDPVFVRGLAKDLSGRRAAKTGHNDAATADFDDAIQDYSNVIEAANSHFLTKAYERRALLLIGRQKNKEAFDDLDYVLARAPQNINALLHHGIVAMRQRTYKQVEKDLTKILTLDPQNVKALQLKGELALIYQDYDNALLSFENALSYCPEVNITRIECLLYKAFTLYLIKDYPTAINVIQDVEPMLVDLTDFERRYLQPKMEILRTYHPSLPENENLSEVDSKKVMKEYWQIFLQTGAADQIRCEMGLACTYYLVASVKKKQQVAH